MYGYFCTLYVYYITRQKAIGTYRPLGYERVHPPLGKVADAPFHAQGAKQER